MPALWIVEALDGFKQGCFRLPPGLPQVAPNQLSLKSFEEGFHVGVRVRLGSVNRSLEGGLCRIEAFSGTRRSLPIPSNRRRERLRVRALG
jgi:hypothetical protein